jgi:hypothetical protein
MSPFGMVAPEGELPRNGVEADAAAEADADGDVFWEAEATGPAVSEASVATATGPGDADSFLGQKMYPAAAAKTITTPRVSATLRHVRSETPGSGVASCGNSPL